MKNLISKIGKIILVIVTLITSALSGYKEVKATEDSSKEIYAKSTYKNMLKYNGEEITTEYVVYKYNGIEYPAYRTSPKGKRVETTGKYSMAESTKLNDVELWKVIINGYPYVFPSSIGCKNKEEAYTATEEAIFCQKYGRKPEEYEAISEAGTRVKKAISNILNNAKTTEKFSDELEINSKEGKFVLDSIDHNYMSQTFTIDIGTIISNVTLSLEGDYPEGTKITNLNNQEIIKYSGFTSFKVIYPVKSATKKGSFKLKGVATTRSHPILYGTVYDLTPSTRSAVMDSEIQQYILTRDEFGDSETYKTLEYEKNDTQITIIKLDKTSNQPLEGVKFRLLDKNKNPIYTDLITNSEGKIVIDNILPGRYYLEETYAKEGYVKYDKQIFISASINEMVKVIVNNVREDNQEYSENNSNITVEKNESNTNININNKNENINEQETNTNININNENKNEQETNINISQNNNKIKLPKTGM